MSAVRAGAAYVEITTRNIQFTKGLRAAQRQLQDFGNSVRLIGSQLLRMGAVAATPMALSVAAFSSFDDAIRAVRAVTQATAGDFEKLRDKAKELGATTSYSASEVALLMTELGRAGFNPSQIVAMTGAVMDLARATGTDATLTSGIMAATIRQFGMEAEDATRVADALTTAANKSFNTVESLGEALKYAGPVAASANMQLEDTLAVLGSLGNMGIQGSDAGTSLRRLLTLSGAEAKQFQKVFGVSTLDAAGDVRPLVDILGDVATATNNLPTGERTKKFAEVFGLLGITAASAIGRSVTNTRELYAELQNAGGAAARTAKEMDAGVGGAFRILKSAAEGVAIAFGEAIEKPLQRATEAISGTLSAVIQWIGGNQEAVKSAAKIALAVMAAGGCALVGLGAAFAAAGSVIGGVLATLSLVGATFSAIGAVIGALLSPLGIITAAVVGLGAYLIHTSGIGAQALAWLGDQFASLKATATEAFGAIGRALAAGDVAAAGRILWLTLKLEWQRGVQALEDYWIGFKDVFLSTTDSMIYGVAGIISEGWASIEVAWVETLGFLSDAWSLFTGTLAKGWHSTVGFIKKAWVRLKSLFDSDINVDAEVERINQEVVAQQQSATDTMLGEIGGREQERLQRRAEIESDRQGRAEALQQMRSEEAGTRENAGRQALASTAAELAAARREWEEAVAALKEASDTAEGAEKPGGASTLKQLQSALAQSSQAVAAEQKAVETKSTFNAFSIRGLGADSLSDRALRAAEATAANTKKLISTIENAGLNYS